MKVEGKNGISANLIKKTKSTVAEAPPIVTFILRFPRMCLSQLSKHRVFSFNSESSRAIKTPKMIERMEARPMTPMSLGKACKGMTNGGAHDGLLEGEYDYQGYYTEFTGQTALEAWDEVKKICIVYAKAYYDAGFHQENVNRILEPFQHIEIILTASDFQNFFELRIAPDSQAEISELARCMKEAYDNTEALEPTLVDGNYYHLPMIREEDLLHGYTAENLLDINAARCCVISYSNQYDKSMMLESALKLKKHLLPENGKPHLSCYEHAARVPTLIEYQIIQKEIAELGACIKDYILQCDFDDKEPDQQVINMIKRKIKQASYFANMNFWLTHRYQKEIEWM